MTARVHVFAGPSVPPNHVRALLPRAVVHGPVAHGDVLRLAPRGGDVLAIIDGLFLHTAAIRHKELLYAMEQGVEVWGAASMGALRAAELAAFGMRPVGLVARLYACGVLDRDDEVALLHATADEEYRPLSEALVSVRVAARRARRRGVIDAEVERRLVEAALGLPFARRHYRTIVRVAVAAGADSRQCSAFLVDVADFSSDIKREDAERLLCTLKAREPTYDPGNLRPSCPRTIHFAQWLRDASGEHIQGHYVTDEAALAFCQAFAPDYSDFHRRLALTAIAGSPGLEDRELETAAIEAAQARGLLPASLSELPPSARSWLTRAERSLSVRDTALLVLIRSFRQPPGIAPTDLALRALRGTPAMMLAKQQVARAHELNAALAERNRSHVARRISEERIRTWFSGRWQLSSSHEHFDVAILDRGFASKAHFVRHARDFFPHAALVGVPSDVPCVLDGLPRR